MKNADEVLFSCSSAEELVEHSHKITLELAEEPRRHFRKVLVAYIAHYSTKKVYQILNGRTVAQILSAFDSRKECLEILETGKVEGTRFTLFEATDRDEISEGPG